MKNIKWEILKEYGFTKDPFPSESPDEVEYWADLEELLETILRFQRIDLLAPTRRIYVYWGELGTGKTYACRFFSNEKIQQKILRSIVGEQAQLKMLNISVTAPEPLRVGDLCTNVYKWILVSLLEKMEKINFDKLLDELKKGPELPYVRALAQLSKEASRQQTLTPDKSIFTLIKDTEEYKFLENLKSKTYGTIGISEAAHIVAYLINSLLESYDRITIWIDELEKLQKATLTERRLFSDFIRRIYDESREALTLILIFSLRTFEEVRELLLPPVWSRIGECKVEFKLISKDKDLIQYFNDNVKHAGVDPTSIIEEEVLEKFVKDILEKYKEGISPRDFNNEVSKLLHLAFMVWRRYGKSEKIKIDKELYEKIKEDQKLIKELSMKLRGTY
jgi:type II secretory pathway predicted ATPase ExeA